MIILSVDWANALDIVIFSFGMVFILLVTLVVVLNLFSKAIAPNKIKIRKFRKTVNKDSVPVQEVEEYEEGHLPANDSAAIAMALYLYYAEAHDVESTVITIKTVERRYSPWSSKIYGVHFLAK